MDEQPYMFIGLLNYFRIMLFKNTLWLVRSNKAPLSILIIIIIIIIILFTNSNNKELLLKDGGWAYRR
jgi:hypothetical protein